MATETEVENLYQAWRKANKAWVKEDERLSGALHETTDAEQRAWDALRDACDDLNPDGYCSHPECPQGLAGDPIPPAH